LAIGEIMITREINVPISEYDLEEFKDIVYNNSSFDWSFTTDDGNTIVVNFMSEDELERREEKWN
jgi:hypothetical protein